MKRMTMTALAFAMVLAGCAPAATGGEARTNRDRITAEEIQASQESNLYEVVESLRPRWLRARGTDAMRPGGTMQTPEGNVDVITPAAVVVYVDGVRRGDIRALRSIPTSGVTALQYLDAREATTRFGSGHTAGAILVTTGGR